MTSAVPTYTKSPRHTRPDHWDMLSRRANALQVLDLLACTVSASLARMADEDARLTDFPHPDETALVLVR